MASKDHSLGELRRDLADMLGTQTDSVEVVADDAHHTERDQSRSLIRTATRPSLFDYQTELAERISTTIRDGGVGLVSLPTGGGKTRTAVAACLQAFRRGAQRIVWLAPSVELVDQAFRTFESMWAEFGDAPDLLLARGKRQRVSPDFPEMFITTPQSVYVQGSRGAALTKWDAVVFDEAHQMAAPTFNSAVSRLRGEGKAASLIGLSATPGRVIDAETEWLVEAFSQNLLVSSRLGRDPVLTLQRRGILARLAFQALTKERVGEREVARRVRIGVRACESIARIRSHVLVFAPSVSSGVVLAELLNSRGVPSFFVHGGTDAGVRDEAISLFGRGEIRVLINFKILATGYDCPAVSDLVLLGRIGSPVMFEQVVGRAARGPRTGGASRARIWELDDHLKVHGRPISYYRYADFQWAGR